MPVVVVFTVAAHLFLVVPHTGGDPGEPGLLFGAVDAADQHAARRQHRGAHQSAVQHRHWAKRRGERPTPDCIGLTRALWSPLWQVDVTQQMQLLQQSGALIIIMAVHQNEANSVFQQAQQFGLAEPQFVWLGINGERAWLTWITCDCEPDLTSPVCPAGRVGACGDRDAGPGQRADSGGHHWSAHGRVRHHHQRYSACVSACSFSPLLMTTRRSGPYPPYLAFVDRWKKFYAHNPAALYNVSAPLTITTVSLLLSFG